MFQFASFDNFHLRLRVCILEELVKLTVILIGKWSLLESSGITSHSKLGDIVVEEKDRSMTEKLPLLELTLVAWPLLRMLMLLVLSIVSILVSLWSVSLQPHRMLWLLKSLRIINGVGNWLIIFWISKALKS